MDRTYIIQKASNLKTKEDLLLLLNEIKADDLGDKCYPFEMRQLNYYCNPNHSYRRYRSFNIPKKSGGFRTISAPCKGLKNILIYLNEMFQAIYEPSSYAMGFALGRSVVDNAKVHLNQNYVLNLDLKNFFPSIHQARVWKRLQLAPFNFNVDIANIIAGLCCMKVKREDAEGEESIYDYVLPQGAPTSPLLTNTICDTLDRRLAGVANRFGLHYSRYADDITFSSMHNVYGEEGEFMSELHHIIAGQNFTLNDAKTRLQKKGSRQEVTGLTVSDRVNVTRKYVREIRSLLYIWEKYGFSVASSKFYPHYKAEKGVTKKGNPHLDSVLSGKLLYLKMVKGENNTTFVKLKEKFEKLMEGQSDISNILDIWEKEGIDNAIKKYYSTRESSVYFKGDEHSKRALTTLDSYNVDEFRNKFNINIKFIPNGNKYKVQCQGKSMFQDMPMYCTKSFNPMEYCIVNLLQDVNRKRFWLFSNGQII